jgi:undecaprenyl-diphosphatase
MAAAIYMVDRRWGAALFALAALVALGRVFVGVHYLSDVLAGAALGSAVAVTVHFLVHKILHTHHRRGQGNGIKD